MGLAAGVIYLSALGNRFVYDDLPLVVWNQRVQSLDRLPDCFTTPYWGEGRTGLYRPPPRG